jgi:hypothetical protein
MGLQLRAQGNGWPDECNVTFVDLKLTGIPRISREGREGRKEEDLNPFAWQCVDRGCAEIQPQRGNSKAAEYPAERLDISSAATGAAHTVAVLFVAFGRQCWMRSVSFVRKIAICQFHHFSLASPHVGWF